MYLCRRLSYLSTIRQNAGRTVTAADTNALLYCKFDLRRGDQKGDDERAATRSERIEENAGQMKMNDSQTGVRVRNNSMLGVVNHVVGP